MTRSRNPLHGCVSSKKRHLPNFTVELKSIARKQIKQALKAATPASFKQPNRCQVVITASTTKCRYGPLHVSTRSYRPEPEQEVTSVSSCSCSLFRKAEDFDDEMKIAKSRKPSQPHLHESRRRQKVVSSPVHRLNGQLHFHQDHRLVPLQSKGSCRDGREKSSHEDNTEDLALSKQ